MRGFVRPSLIPFYEEFSRSNAEFADTEGINCRKRIYIKYTLLVPTAGMKIRMTPDEERWAEAALIRRQQGDRAELWIAERMGILASAGDWAGVERFRDIASRLEQLTHSSMH